MSRGQAIVVEGREYRVHRVDVEKQSHERDFYGRLKPIYAPMVAWLETTTGCSLKFRPTDVVEAYIS